VLDEWIVVRLYAGISNGWIFTMYEYVDIVLYTVCIVTRLQAGQLRNLGFIPSRRRRCFLLRNVHTISGAYPASYTMDTGGCFPRVKAEGT
jgi:hypothetical protein